MSRFTAPIALVTALLVASPATAGVLPKQYGGQSKLGTGTSSRSPSGSCSVGNAKHTHVMLRCSGSSGRAKVTYLFRLKGKSGSVMAQVNFVGSHRGAVVTTKRLSDSQFRVDVTLDSAGRAEIESVMIEYYCH